MLFDINCATGHWPFRRLPMRSLPELKEHLESFGIGGAAVTHNHAVCYQNVHDANLELAEALDRPGMRDYFVGVATLNPLYPAWAKDLRGCVETLGFRALRLLPAYHRYALDGPEAGRILTLAGELGLPVLIPDELVNFRQRHFMEPEAPLGLSAIIAAARKFPGVRLVVLNGTPVAGGEYPDNLYFEISRLRSAFGDVFGQLAARCGADHLLFGSGAPFKEVEPALLKLHHAPLSAEAQALVASGNARRLFQL
ncbi:hypothetical protein SDC9_103947 [bioreactor metagenome]|uniref:Amidohydrolase-related domain-containing protein n=1 Tax=bioreactor metagenome TaxID=1076179 RepID=A0A645AWE6_9ZZZZ